MPWEWSHTPEAYADAQANLEAMPKEELEVIYAEWIAYAPEGHFSENGFSGDDFDADAYADAHLEAKSLAASDLADTIWQLASDQATCDNGGFNAWVCPFGCGCHKVPFDREHSHADC